jgi:hypothetical protein
MHHQILRAQFLIRVHNTAPEKGSKNVQQAMS